MALAKTEKRAWLPSYVASLRIPAAMAWVNRYVDHLVNYDHKTYASQAFVFLDRRNLPITMTVRQVLAQTAFCWSAMNKQRDALAAHPRLRFSTTIVTPIMTNFRVTDVSVTFSDFGAELHRAPSRCDRKVPFCQTKTRPMHPTDRFSENTECIS